MSGTVALALECRCLPINALLAHCVLLLAAALMETVLVELRGNLKQLEDDR